MSTPAFPDRAPHRRQYKPRHREDVIATRLTPDEKAEITAAARRAGLFPSGFLAEAGLAAARGSTTIQPNRRLDDAIDELTATRTALARIGNNINQIAYIYNSASTPRPGELDHALAALVQTLARIDDTATALVGHRS
ncbi:plasmid mobilization relaxosome protein MobC [Streptacidiphilus sp. EB103A]|uniref:plasmid mobilization protein n=1 Tax=Streptacidiphilus sp. EB103A TaxID=3156275 RepID=UPI003512AF20